MDLNNFIASNDPQKMTLCNPATNEELTNDGKPVTISVIGPDSGKIKEIDRKIAQRRLNSVQTLGRAKKNLTIDEVERETVERSAAAITGWSGIFQGGKEVKYSPSEALRLMGEFEWMRVQVIDFLNEPGNFLPGSTGT